MTSPRLSRVFVDRPTHDQLAARGLADGAVVVGESALWRDLWPVLASLALLAYVATCGVGCGPHTRTRYVTVGGSGPDESTVSMVTTSGVTVRYPPWLDLPINAVSRARALEEIATVPLAVPAPDGSAHGVPSGVTVVIRNPGAWPSSRSPTGLVQGMCWHAENRVEVAWAGTSGAAVKLPALAHELHHLLTGDPLAGH